MHSSTVIETKSFMQPLRPDVFVWRSCGSFSPRRVSQINNHTDTDSEQSNTEKTRGSFSYCHHGETRFHTRFLQKRLYFWADIFLHHHVPVDRRTERQGRPRTGGQCSGAQEFLQEGTRWSSAVFSGSCLAGVDSQGVHGIWINLIGTWELLAFFFSCKKMNESSWWGKLH